MYFNRLLIVILLLTAAPIILPQEDSTKTEKDWDWHWDKWEDWTVDFGFKKTRPAISLQY